MVTHDGMYPNHRVGQDLHMPALRVVFVPDDLSTAALTVWPERDSVPSQAAVGRFVRAVGDDPAVGVEVLGRLRSMSVGRGDVLLAYVGGLLAVMGLLFAISSLSSLARWFEILVIAGGMIAALIISWLLIKAGEIATELEERSRLATAWLGAFEDGLALAPNVRRAQSRALRRAVKQSR